LNDFQGRMITATCCSQLFKMIIPTCLSLHPRDNLILTPQKSWLVLIQLAPTLTPSFSCNPLVHQILQSMSH
jgi:hypothetical protein